MDGEYNMLKVNQMIVFREGFDDSSVLFDPVIGKVFYLNHVATFIWQQLCLENNLDEIENGIRSKFSNTPENLKFDLDNFLQSLLDNGFVGNLI